MSDKPISPLRQRMLEDMNMRRFVFDTQREYIRAVKKLASFLGRSPDTATPEELRAFQLHLTETGLQPQSINATVTALRFFFKVTLDRPETTRRLVFVYEPRKLPRVLSPEEVLRLLEAAPGPKHKAALSVAYGAGLRAMEVVALKVCDIDSKRMMLRVEQGKGGKDRHAMLSPTLLELLLQILDLLWIGIAVRFRFEEQSDLCFVSGTGHTRAGYLSDLPNRVNRCPEKCRPLLIGLELVAQRSSRS